MSTKAIREALEVLRAAGYPETAREAMADVEAIEKAAADVLNEEMQDADASTAAAGMKRYHSACDLFDRIAKEAKR